MVLCLLLTKNHLPKLHWLFRIIRRNQHSCFLVSFVHCGNHPLNQPQGSLIQRGFLHAILLQPQKPIILLLIPWFGIFLLLMVISQPFLMWHLAIMVVLLLLRTQAIVWFFFEIFLAFTISWKLHKRVLVFVGLLKVQSNILQNGYPTFLEPVIFKPW